MAGIVGNVLFVLDIGMLIVGVWTLVKGSLPQGLLETLFGKGNYGADVRTSRRFGALLVAPIVGFSLAVVLVAMIGEAASSAATLNFLLSISVVVISIGWVRQIRNANKAGS